jgi:hypothetical protein
MSYWSTNLGGGSCEAGGIVTATTDLTTATTGGIDTYGAWVELIASTTRRTSAAIVRTIVASTGTYESQIGIGSAGNEVVLMDGFIQESRYNASNVAQGAYYLHFVNIPSGRRVSFRARSHLSTRSLKCAIYLFPYSFIPEFSACRVEAAGGIIGSTIDPGATINTKGAWTEMTASTTAAWNYVSYSQQFEFDSLVPDGTFLVDVAVGSAGNEQVVVSNSHFKTDSGFDSCSPTCSGVLFCHIPRNSRVAVRAQSSYNTAGTRDFKLKVQGGVF